MKAQYYARDYKGLTIFPAQDCEGRTCWKYRDKEGYESINHWYSIKAVKQIIKEDCPNTKEENL